jgi:hypothetical protein
MTKYVINKWVNYYIGGHSLRSAVISYIGLSLLSELPISDWRNPLCPGICGWSRKPSRGTDCDWQE